MDTTNKEFTLIIHGPLSMHTVFSLYRHASMLPIVIVAPRPAEYRDNNILKEIHNFMQINGKRVSLFLYDDTIDTKLINNDQNRYYHFYSVFLGLQTCLTPYTIKIRSDEFYSNLMPIMASVKKNESKLVTTDVFFRNCAMPYHPSDHVMAGTTKIMLEVFDAAKQMCQGIDVSNTKQLMKHIQEITGKPFVAAEQILGVCAVATQTSSSKLKEPDCAVLMKELFHIVRTDELGMFRIMFNSAKPNPMEYTDTKFYNGGATGTDVNDMDNYICEKKV